MKNPIPSSSLFYTPSLEELQAQIETLPKKDRALVYNYVMQTLNACNRLVEDEFAILSVQEQ